MADSLKNFLRRSPGDLIFVTGEVGDFDRELVWVAGIIIGSAFAFHLLRVFVSIQLIAEDDDFIRDHILKIRPRCFGRSTSSQRI